MAVVSDIDRMGVVIDAFQRKRYPHPIRRRAIEETIELHGHQRFIGRLTDTMMRAAAATIA